MSSYRTFLFVPGSKPERCDKALRSGADAVIIDLEDAVALDRKDEARRSIVEWARAARRVLVRINARGTAWFEQDALLGKLPGVAGIVLPKAEGADDVVALISLIKGKIPVFPLIESAQGMWNALQIAKAPFVKQLMFGTLDFVIDMSVELDNDELNTQRAVGERVVTGSCILDALLRVFEKERTNGTAMPKSLRAISVYRWQLDR